MESFLGGGDSAFEIMQLKEKSEHTASSSLWLINKINYYFESGHFDMWDISVIWLGVIVILLFWKIICKDL